MTVLEQAAQNRHVAVKRGQHGENTGTRMAKNAVGTQA